MNEPVRFDEPVESPDALDHAIKALARAATRQALQQALADFPCWSEPNIRALLTERIDAAWQRNDTRSVRDALACRSMLIDHDTLRAALLNGDELPLPLGEQSPFGQLLKLAYISEHFSSRARLINSILEDIDSATEPDLWAELQRERADTLAQIEGDGRAERIEQALASYAQVRNIWDRHERGSPRWARTVRAMARTYRYRVKGERSANLGVALALYEEALEQCDRRGNASEWAAAKQGIGTIWMEMPAVDRARQIDTAISHYQAALNACDRAQTPELWASITHDLALAYSEHPGAARQHNLEHAITQLEAVLDTQIGPRSREKDALGWARSTVALGNAYVLRLQDDRTRNLERAILCYTQALSVLTRAEHPAEWAQVHHNLGIAYWNRLADSGANNLWRAILACRHALKVYTPEAYPIERAHVLTALGNFYNHVRGSKRVRNLEQAIACYTQALELCPREADPDAWATAMSNLGNAYADIDMPDRPSNLNRAIHCYKQALEVRSLAAAPEHYAETANNLGVTYIDPDLGEAVDPGQALYYLGEAMNVYQPIGFPHDARRTARNLGHLHLARSDWQAADQAYQQAIQANELLYKAALTERSRQAELAESQDIYADRAYALARRKRLHEAIACVEAGRARILAESLDLRQLDEQALPAHKRKQQQATIDEIRRQQAMLRAGQQSLAAAADSLEQLYRQLPNPIKQATFEQIAAAATPDQALVYLVATPVGSMALIVTHAGQTHDDKPNRNRLAQMLRVMFASRRHREAVDVVWMDSFKSAALDQLLGARAVDAIPESYLPGRREDLERLGTSLANTLAKLGSELLAPLAARMRKLKVSRAAIIACGRLSLLPLHAARYLVGERQRSLIDEFEIVYTPSARALSEVRRAAKQRQAGSHLAGIGNPLPNKQTLAALHEQLLAAVQELADDGQIAGVRSDLEQLLLEYSTEDLVGDGARLRELARQLPTEGGAQVRDLARRWPVPLRFAVDEVHCIESVWPADTADLLTEQAATREALELLFPAATLIHLACHGEFQPAAPLTSGLKLAGEDRLTLNDLLGQTTNRLANTRLVVLSACQTAITDTRTLPEEAIGLPAGFMQAGVPAVIGTLWSVDDASTALLMARFYELTVLQELRPASALREAQRWLRDLSTAQLKEYLAQHTSKPGTVSAAKPLISPALELGLSELLNRVGPREQPFDNPYFWAPFTFHGAYEAAI